MLEVWCCRVAHLCLHVAAVLHGRGRGDRRPARLAAHAHLQEIPHHLFAIEFGTDLDGTQDFFQLFWPIVLSHRIDESSPLWSVSPEDLMTEQFEIILTMEGTTPETGNNIQVRTSYLPSEILWGYKFQHSCVHFNKTIGKYEVSFNTLNTIVKDNTPRYAWNRF